MSKEAQDDMTDNLTRMVEYHAKNQKYFRIRTNMEDKDLFTPVTASDSMLHQYASIVKSTRTEKQQTADQYAIVSFWKKNADDRHTVEVPVIIPRALSRFVNLENRL